jgi:hypothetical protein
MVYFAREQGLEHRVPIALGGHPKAATRGHLKTGQRSVATLKTGQ